MTESINFDNVINEYEKLVNLKNIDLTLDNGDKVSFHFKMSQLPHLLGLQHIKDIPLFFKYSEKHICASDLLKELKKGTLSQMELDQSDLFKDIYNTRIQYFNSKHIMNLLLNGIVIAFNPSKIKCFETKLDKIDYMIWESLEDGYSHLGLGFSVDDDIGHPNTFFYRTDRDYIEEQTICNKITVKIKNPECNEREFFKIYWENICESLADNTHYKNLNKHIDLLGCDINDITEEKIHNLDPNTPDKEFIRKEFNLFQMDKIKHVYEPYFSADFRWNNKEKLFIMNKIVEKGEDFPPSAVSVLLNDFRQKESN